MCGLTAMFSPSGGVNAAVLRRMTDAVAHRGPDGEGCFICPSGKIGLGHRRLSIVDLAGGAQPLWNEDRTMFAVVAGEFYDYAALRAGLQARGHRFRTGSDSEILIHLYEEDGDDCVQSLRGEFSFCLWDGVRERLLVVRDRFGIKPVYYTLASGNLLVASEVKALLAAGVTARWDREAVLSQLFLCLPYRRTLFESVFQLPPGHWLEASGDGIHVGRYWDLDYPGQAAGDDPAVDEAELLLRLKDSLDDAVRVRLQCDVSSCFLVSGGIDSGSVIGLARRHLSESPSAFTVCFDDESVLEREAAERTARHVGAHFVPYLVSESDLADNFGRTVCSGEMLALNGHAVARSLHAAAIAAAGYKVALSGSGSDDILGGYPALRQDLLIHQGGPGADGAAGLEALVPVQARLGFTPSWMRKVATDRSLFFLLLQQDMLDLFDAKSPYAAFMEDIPYEAQLAGRHPIHQSAYLWNRAFLANYELHAERLEMAHGLEVRLPFLDTRVFDVARRLPVDMLIRNGQEKYALRQAVRGVVHQQTYSAPKRSFTAPLTLLDPGSALRTLLEDSVRSERFRSQTMFDAKAVTGFLDGLQDLPDRAKVACDSVLTMLLSAACLGEEYRLL